MVTIELIINIVGWTTAGTLFVLGGILAAGYIDHKLYNWYNRRNDENE